MAEKAEDQDTEPPAADAGSDVVVSAGSRIEFDGSNSSDDFAIKWHRWDYQGDGDFDHLGATGTTYYDEPGVYRATLTVVDYLDQRDTDTQTVIVVPPEGPTANIGVRERTTERTVVFNASGTHYNETVVGYDWDFDGNGTDVSSANVSHTFESPGTHTVELTVTDAAGNTDTDSVVVEVLDVTAPEAEIDGPAAATVNDTVTFRADNSTDDVGVTSYAWDFDGDGTTDATGPTVDHSFSRVGDRQVTVVVTDAAGNTDTARRDVAVESESTVIAPQTGTAAENTTSEAGTSSTSETPDGATTPGSPTPEALSTGTGDGPGQARTPPGETTTGTGSGFGLSITLLALLVLVGLGCRTPGTDREA